MFGDEWSDSDPAVEAPTGDQGAEVGQQERASKRFAEVQNEIGRLCRDGILSSALRGEDGGEFFPGDRLAWNTERLSPRFRACRLNPREPYSSVVAGLDFLLIYIERASLDKYLNAPPTDFKTGHLSPYLALMLRVAKSRNITPENQPKKMELMSILREEWPPNVALTERLVDAMATLLREPESQGGKARGKAPPSKSGDG
jgi:hypothetical protein